MQKFTKTTLPFIAAVTLLVLATATVSMAGVCFIPPPAVPEIDAATGVGALSLIAGAVLVIRGRRKK